MPRSEGIETLIDVRVHRLSNNGWNKCPDQRGLRQFCIIRDQGDKVCWNKCPDQRGLRLEINLYFLKDFVYGWNKCPDQRGLRHYASSHQGWIYSSWNKCPDQRGLRPRALHGDAGAPFGWNKCPDQRGLRHTTQYQSCLRIQVGTNAPIRGD